MADSARLYEDYTLNFQAVGSSESVSVNGGPYVSVNGAIGGYQTVVNQQLAILPQAAAVRIDNPTPFLVYLPEQNIQVGPGVTGAYFVFPVPIQRVNVQVQWIANTPIQSFSGQGGGLNTVVRYYQVADGQSTGGTTQAQGIAVFHEDSSFNFITTPHDTQLFVGSAPNGAHAISGYDNGSPDGQTVPARTPNVIYGIVGTTNASSGNGGVLGSYTPPAGKKWRLLGLNISTHQGGAGSLPLWWVAEGGSNITGQQSFGPGAYANKAYTFPGVGIAAGSPNSVLNLWGQDNGLGGTQIWADLFLYVGP